MSMLTKELAELRIMELVARGRTEALARRAARPGAPIALRVAGLLRRAADRLDGPAPAEAEGPLEVCLPAG
jgi:hypothetical protein